MSDIEALEFIVGLGISVLIFVKLIEKPFDKIMDFTYPNDRPPSESYWKNR